MDFVRNIRANSFFAVLFAVYLLVGCSPYFAYATTCQSLFAAPSLNKNLGPGYTGSRYKRVSITQSEKKQIREKIHPQYKLAFDFSSAIGKQFGELVLSRLPRDKRTTIVLAMGGAEHLGTLLEVYLAKFAPEVKVDFKYVPMPTKLINPWSAYRKSTDPNRAHYDFDRASGVGEIPVGFELSPGSKNESDPHAFARYLAPFGLMKNENVLVIDTGLRGTQPESVAYTLRMMGFRGNVEGVLLAHYVNVVNRVTMHSLSREEYDYREGFPDRVFYWAHVLDNNTKTGRFFGDENAFQRSDHYEVVEGPNGQRSIKITPNTSPEQLLNYKATLLGILDGIK